jgi:hypothetical protein
MITVHFVRADGREAYSAGPTHWVRASDGWLEIGPDGWQIAHYCGGLWSIDGHDLPKCIIHGSQCMAHFDAGAAPSDVQGPFEQIAFIDGSVYGQPGCHLLAHLNEQQRTWYSYEGQQSWPNLVVET